jgi:hypothetical protein
MRHEAIHLRRQVRHGALGLAGVQLGELGKGLHAAVEHLVAALHLFHEFARVDVRVAAAGHVVDHFGWDQDRADGRCGRVVGFLGGEVGECGEGVGEFDAVGGRGWAGLSVGASIIGRVILGAREAISSRRCASEYGNAHPFLINGPCDSGR